MQSFQLGQIHHPAVVAATFPIGEARSSWMQGAMINFPRKRASHTPRTPQSSVQTETSTRGFERYTRRIPDYYFEFSADAVVGTTAQPDDVRIKPYPILNGSEMLTDMRLAQLLDEIHQHRSAPTRTRLGPDWHHEERGLFPIRSMAELAYPARLVAKEPPAMQLSEEAEKAATLAAAAQPLHRPLLVMFPRNTLVWVSINAEPTRTILSDMIDGVDQRDINDALAIAWIV